MPPPQNKGATVSLDHAFPLLNSFNSFLTVAIHNILFYRSIYPSATFLSTKAYNLNVHQNRHPKVCDWIRDAVSAVATQIANGQVSRIAVVIHSPLDGPSPSPSPSWSSNPDSSGNAAVPPGSVLERWMFDVSWLPAWPANKAGATGAKAMADFGRTLAKESRSEASRDMPLRAGETPVSGPDVDEQLRGALRRMAHAAEGMAALPTGCTFTVAVELRDEAKAPIGYPQAWIPSEPNLQPASKGKAVAGSDIGGAKATPIRSVEAGPMFFECWVEEAKAKEVLLTAKSKDREQSQ
ncbi:DNA-binding protein [Lasiosphaeria hispida]|uniref:DNA-binding protein n=1 Tax=Lasiosphaeria hispida TaxID=260671 RepID=A0AAJ0HHD0_9PEZI|nr:DNA-binding protein [Lasiosphaeria hispida]